MEGVDVVLVWGRAGEEGDAALDDEEEGAGGGVEVEEEKYVSLDPCSNSCREGEVEETALRVDKLVLTLLVCKRLRVLVPASL